MTKSLLSLAAGTLLAGAMSLAHADSISVNMAGFQTAGGWEDPGNTSIFVSIAPGSTVTSWEYINFSFATQGASWLSEFVISVNNSDASGYMDALLSLDDTSGTFGPASGTFGIDTPDFIGDPFVVADGIVWVTGYELLDDSGVDAIVSSGTLRINFTSPIPEPATYAMFGLGIAGLAAFAKRRKSI